MFEVSIAIPTLRDSTSSTMGKFLYIGGQFNVFEVVNDNNQYKNLGVFSTNMFGYAGYVGCEYKPRGKTDEGLAWAKPYL